MLLQILTLTLAALALVGCLAQFLVLKREIWRKERKQRDEQSMLLDTIGSMQLEIASLRQEVDALAAGPPLAGEASLNLSKRTRALRMHRRGDRPDQIAAALNVSQNEIDLMLKVQDLVDNAP